MRRVGAWELVSLDGVMERPEEWAYSYSDDEMGEASASGMAASLTRCCSEGLRMSIWPPTGPTSRAASRWWTT
jgi:hypothetical protein